MPKYVHGIDVEAQSPPTLLYVVDQGRLLAGKGVLELRNAAWRLSETADGGDGGPLGVIGTPQNDEGESVLEPTLYALFDCYALRADAISNAAMRIAHVVQQEALRYAKKLERLNQLSAALNVDLIESAKNSTVVS